VRDAQACEVAKAALIERTSNNQADPAKFRNDLLNIARTTLSSKILTQVLLARFSPTRKHTVGRVSTQFPHGGSVLAALHLPPPSPRSTTPPERG
jgi:hypothetical protein